MHTQSRGRLAVWGRACALLIVPTLAMAQSGQPPTGPPTTAPLVNDNVKDQGTKTAPPRVTTEVLPPVPATASDPAPPGTRAVRVDAPDPGTVPATAPAAAPAAPVQRTSPDVQVVEGVVTKVLTSGKELSQERLRFILDPAQDWESFVTRGPAGLAIRERDSARVAIPDPVDPADMPRTVRVRRPEGRVVSQTVETLEQPAPGVVRRTETVVETTPAPGERVTRTETTEEPAPVRERRIERDGDRVTQTETTTDPAPVRERRIERDREQVTRTETTEETERAPATDRERRADREREADRVIAHEPVHAGEAPADADEVPGLEMVVTARTHIYAFARSPEGHDLYGAATTSTPDATGDRRVTPVGPKPSNFTNIREGSFVSARYRRTGDVFEVLNLYLIELPLLPTAPTAPRAAPAAPAPGATAPIGTVPGAPAAMPGRVRVPTVPTTPSGPGIP